MTRWPGWQSSHRGDSPTGTHQAPGIALQRSSIRPPDRDTGMVALFVHAPLRCIVLSTFGLSEPGSLGRLMAGLGPCSASQLPVAPGLPVPPSHSQAKAQQLDFFFCDSM